MTDNKTVKERLKEFINYIGIGQTKFEANCGLSNGYVNNIRVSIQPKTLQKIALSYPDLNRAWLLTGEGEMIVDNQHLNKEESGDTIVLPVSVWKIIQAQAESLVIRDRQLDARDRQIEELIKLLKSQMEENRKNDVRTDNATCADAG